MLFSYVLCESGCMCVCVRVCMWVLVGGRGCKRMYFRGVYSYVLVYWVYVYIVIIDK